MASARAPVFPRDDLGREVALQAPARRVIVIGPGAIETVFALGLGKLLVGRDDYADFPPEAKSIAIAGNYQGPSVEKSVALRPDLVIVQGETYDPERAGQWQKQIGVPVAILVATDVSGVEKGMQKIAKWLGQNAKAKPSAFIEIGRSPLYTAGQKTLVGDVLNWSGWKNVAQVSGYQPYGLESLLAKQPDVYIVPTKAKREVVVRQLRENAALSQLKCVRQGRIVVIDPDLVLRPGPRLKSGILQLQKEAARLASQQGS